MLKVRRATWIAVGYALLLAACSPPLATTPTAAPQKPAASQSAPAAASAPTRAEAPKPVAPAADDDVAKVKALYYDAAKREAKLVIYGGGSPDQFGPVKDAF